MKMPYVLMPVRVPLDVRAAIEKWQAKQKRAHVSMSLSDILAMGAEKFMRDEGMLPAQKEPNSRSVQALESSIQALEKRLDAIEQQLRGASALDDQPEVRRNPQ